jgi:hypothetical protein
MPIWPAASRKAGRCRMRIFGAADVDGAPDLRQALAPPPSPPDSETESSAKAQPVAPPSAHPS